MTESGSVLNCQCKMIRGLIYLGCNNHKVIKGHFGLYSLYQVRIEIRITIDIFPTEDRKIDLFPPLQGMFGKQYYLHGIVAANASPRERERAARRAP